MNAKFRTRRPTLQIQTLLIIAFIFCSSLIAKAETNGNGWATVNSHPIADAKRMTEVHILHGAMYLLFAGILYFGFQSFVATQCPDKLRVVKNKQEPRKRSRF